MMAPLAHYIEGGLEIVNLLQQHLSSPDEMAEFVKNLIPLAETTEPFFERINS